MRGPDDHAHEVRDDEPDERDDPGERHARRDQQRHDDDRDEAEPLDVDAEVAGGALAQRQQVERAREQQRGDEPDGDERCDDPHRSHRLPLRLPSCQNTICSRLRCRRGTPGRR